MSDIGLDVGLANELKLAFRRHDYTLQEVQELKEGEILGLVRGVLRGTHEIRLTDYMIDLGSPAQLPFDEAVLHAYYYAHEKVPIELRGDTLYLNYKPLGLFCSERQKSEVGVGGLELYEELKRRGDNVGAKVLDYLVAHPKLWPESWKRSLGWSSEPPRVHAWGDIFQNPADGHLFVRYAFWDKGKVRSGYACYHWLGYNLNQNQHALVFTI